MRIVGGGICRVRCRTARANRKKLRTRTAERSLMTRTRIRPICVSASYEPYDQYSPVKRWESSSHSGAMSRGKKEGPWGGRKGLGGGGWGGGPPAAAAASAADVLGRLQRPLDAPPLGAACLREP